MSVNNLNVTFLIASLSSGAGTERASISLANKLVDLDYDVSIVVLKGGQSFFEINSKVRVFILCDIYEGKKSFIKSWFKLSFLLRKISTDVLINVGTELSLMANVNVPAKTKIISCEHFTYSRNLCCGKLKLCMWLSKIYSTRIVVLTNVDAKDWNSKKVVVIPNSTPFVIDESSDCKSLNVMSVGRLVYNKGFDLLIKAWATVVQYHKDAVLNIFGEGVCRDTLMNLIEDNKLNDSVRINPPTRNIQSELLKSSLYVLPSRFEPFGIVLIEAMECGLPIVSFKSIGPLSILKNGEDSILVEKGNIQQLSDNIIDMLSHEQKRIKMGARAKENVRRFHIDNVVQQWEKLFTEIL